MALSRLTNWSDGDVLTSAALEAEFDNIYNNALTLISPLTGNLAAGGNILTGLGLGSVSSPSLQFTGDTNTGIYSATADDVSTAIGGIRGWYVSLSGTVSTGNLRSTGPGATGPVLTLWHDSASPADADNTGVITFKGNDDGAVARAVAQIIATFDDVTATTMDSGMTFNVMNNVNAGDVNTSATLSSLGVWTDASSREGKEFIGDVIGVIEKMRTLEVGVYRGRDIPPEKQATAERHFSATAEDFFAAFGLGRPGTTGIAPKDVAFLALRGLGELDDKVEAVTRRVEALEGGRPIPGGR
jgi:hypothetical protein